MKKDKCRTTLGSFNNIRLNCPGKTAGHDLKTPPQAGKMTSSQ